MPHATDLGRRQFLRSAAAIGLLPLTVQKALALPANRATGTIKDIEHVVILMQENRSFDHYFGSLRGVRGFGDPRPVPLPDGGNVWQQPNPGSTEPLLPFRLNTETTAAARLKSLDHSWKGSQDEWNGWDVWVSRKTGFTMGYLNREDLPYYYALADAFTICDAYHCSIFGPTDPNRLYFFSGTSGLAAGNQAPQTVTNNGVDDNWTADMTLDAPDVDGLEWETYADKLEDAGVSWKLYQEYDNFGDNALANFKRFRKLDPASQRYARGRAIAPGSSVADTDENRGQHLIADFTRDVNSGTLPQVSWIVAPTALCEHPDAPPGFGEVMISKILEILVAQPEVWAKTAFIINYDENDGFFDHIPAPVPAHTAEHGVNQAPIEGELLGTIPVGLGPRVPMLVVSPWSKGGWVNSELLDHTSVLRFLEQRFGVKAPNITPWRRAVTGDLTSAFDFANPDLHPLAPLPDTTPYEAQILRAEKLAAPVIPTGAGQMPRQEAGVRPARPLPYATTAAAVADAHALALSIDNHGALGATFLLYDLKAKATPLHKGPRHYTVTTHVRDRIAHDGEYALSLYGPNGFLRSFHGTGADELAVNEHYDSDGIVLDLTNHGAMPLTVTISPGFYPHAPAQTQTLKPGERKSSIWALHDSNHWYDLKIAIAEKPEFSRQLAGHVENGKPSQSDPAFARA